jgi:transcriptional regulator of arginine metabolism
MKSRRHRRIMEIVNNQRVATQEELCEALRSNGFDVTQATVSRDIKELHLVKIPDGDGYRYAVPDAAVVNRDQERLHRIMKDSVIHMDYSENIIVIKTFPGGAQSVASGIDSSELDGILGTVAGDDTIFIVVKPKEAVVKVFNHFRQLI